MKYIEFFTDLKGLLDPWAYWPLKKATDLQLRYGLSLQQVAGLDLEEIAEKFDEMGVKDPFVVAGRFLNSLRKIAALHPSVTLPEIEKPGRPYNKLIRRRDEPEHLRRDLATALLCRKRGGCSPDSLGNNQSQKTFYGQVRDVRVFMAALRRAPEVKSVGNTFGLEKLTSDKISQLAFNQLKKDGYTAKAISKIGYAVLAMLRTVLGDNHKNVSWFQDHLAAPDNYPPKNIPYDDALCIQKLLASGAVALLMGAPARILERASEAGLDRKDRHARLAYAAAISLKINHIGISEEATAHFDMDSDISGENGQEHVQVKSRAKVTLREKANPETIRILTEMKIQRKEDFNVENSLLFPTRKALYNSKEHTSLTDSVNTKRASQFRSVSPVMQGVYAELQKVTGMYLTFSEIKDLMITYLLESGVSSFVVAKRAGYANERSLILRHQHLFKSGWAGE